MFRRPPRSPLFPYPPLFRSQQRQLAAEEQEQTGQHGRHPPARRSEEPANDRRRRVARPVGPAGRREDRSEEHTSELQSRQYLVCRLLLEKKKTAATQARHSA